MPPKKRKADAVDQSASSDIGKINEIVDKAVLLQIGRPKSLKTHWFYKSGHRTCEKHTSGFTLNPVRATGPPGSGYRFGVWPSNTREDELRGALTAKAVQGIKENVFSWIFGICVFTSGLAV